MGLGRIGFQIQARRFGCPRRRLAGLQQPPAEVEAARAFGHSHLADLIAAVGHGHQRTAADGFAVALGDEDMAALVEDDALRVGQDQLVLGLQHIAARKQPVLVQRPPGGCVVGAVVDDSDGHGRFSPGMRRTTSQCRLCRACPACDGPIVEDALPELSWSRRPHFAQQKGAAGSHRPPLLSWPQRPKLTLRRRPRWRRPDPSPGPWRRRRDRRTRSRPWRRCRRGDSRPS